MNTLGTPGLDTNIATEKAVRAAINSVSGGTVAYTTPFQVTPVTSLSISSGLGSFNVWATCFTPGTATVVVTSATSANPMVITTGSAHGLVTGQQVYLSGWTGNWTAANTTSAGPLLATVLSSTSFSIPLDARTFSGAIGSPTLAPMIAAGSASPNTAAGELGFQALTANTELITFNAGFVGSCTLSTGQQGPAGPTGPAGTAGTNGTNGINGANGSNGTSFTWRGAWSGVTAYAINDTVSSGGNSYIAIASGTNQIPPNATYWNLLAAQGSSGPGSGTVTNTAGNLTAGKIVTGNGSADLKTGAASADTLSAPHTCIAASASGSAYTCTTSPSFVPVAGDIIYFGADVANTGAATLAVNSQSGTPSISKQGGGTALAANDLLAGQQVPMIFDGTKWQMQGQTGNASGASGGCGIMFGNSGGTNVSTGPATTYLTLTSVSGTESTAQFVAPCSGIVKSLFFTSVSTQSSTGNLVVTVRTCTPTNGACTGVASAVTTVVNASATANQFTDLAHTVSVNAGDYISVQLQNNATVASCQFKSWGLRIQ